MAAGLAGGGLKGPVQAALRVSIRLPAAAAQVALVEALGVSLAGLAGKIGFSELEFHWAPRKMIGPGCDAHPAPAGDRINQHGKASAWRLHNLVAVQRVGSGRVFWHRLVSGAGLIMLGRWAVIYSPSAIITLPWPKRLVDAGLVWDGLKAPDLSMPP